MSTTRVPRDPGLAADPRAYGQYFRALADRDVSIEMTARPPWESFPDSEHTVRLPERPLLSGGLTARAWHRVALAHRALHHEMGTFAVRLARADERLARPLRAGVEGRGDLETFLAGFANRRLALQVFQALEDLRVDAELPRRFPGLRPEAEAMLAAAASRRPEYGTLAPRTAAVETLVRCSLASAPRSVPAPIAPAAGALVALAAALQAPGTAVEDVLVATVRAYAVIAALPNLGVLGAAATVDLGHVAPDSAPWPDPWPERAREAIEGEAILDVTVAPVAHRDDLTGRVWQAPGPSAPSEQAVYTWHAADTADSETAAAAGVSGPPEPLPHEHHDVARDLHQRERGPLERGGPHSYVYPEWDSQRGALLPRWCRVIEQQAAQADARAVHDLQRHHQLLAARLRRLMQAVAPRALHLERRTNDGDDVDFDAAVEALLDLRTGRTPRDGVYQRLRPQRRDVVVGMVIDASASTGERVPEAPPLAPAARPAHARTAYRDHPRVLDIEMLAAVLCLTAIDAVGDASVAWAFSGTGREAVRMHVVKGLDEPFGGRVLRRAAAVRPGHATRMGAAIRHAVTVLAAAPHATRLLLVLSDGRPYDIGYGHHYGEDAAAGYAVADTAHAVGEARRAGVRPFLLTIGDDGDDDLSAACPGDSEMLRDVTILPERLTGLYHDLTASVRPAVVRTAVNQ